MRKEAWKHNLSYCYGNIISVDDIGIWLNRAIWHNNECTCTFEKMYIKVKSYFDRDYFSNLVEEEKELEDWEKTTFNIRYEVIEQDYVLFDYEKEEQK